MRPTRIDLGGITLRLNVIDAAAEPEPETKNQTVGDFYWEFLKMGKTLVNAPQRNPSHRDLGIAKRLMTKYDSAEMKELMRRFWFRWAEPYFETQRDVMVLFAAALPDIEASVDKRDQ